MESTPSGAVAEKNLAGESAANLGRLANLRFDAVSGFLVSLIALPLCLGIAKASGFPPIAGLITAVIGGLICPMISNSELTIKGPAAGMIAIVLGAMFAFGYTQGEDPARDLGAYRAVLAIGVMSGLIQIVLGLARAGALGELFPAAPVHGLLASIGVIIMSKQIHVVLGVKPAGSEPLHLIREIPESIRHANPRIALIGVASLVLMFVLSSLRNKVRLFKIVPAQLIVLAIAIPLGVYFHLADQEVFFAAKEEMRKSPGDVLVPLPKELSSAIQLPSLVVEGSASVTTSTGQGGESEVPVDGESRNNASADVGASTLFSATNLPKTLVWVAMFTVIGSLESLLSAKAIDLLDPWQRKSDLNRDLVGIGVANTASAMLGGLPMISEILRSSANKDNGARTRLANMFHGLFLFLAIVLAGSLIRMIPMAALAAMLVFAGYRLASPKQFLHVYQVGPEQLLVFVATMIGVLSTDLLVGILIGMAVEVFCHLAMGAPFIGLVRPAVQVAFKGSDLCLITASPVAAFTNWMPLRKRIVTEGLLQNKSVELDLSQTRVVDHTVMERLEELEREFARRGLHLAVVGLDQHRPMSGHPCAARRQSHESFSEAREK